MKKLFFLAALVCSMLAIQNAKAQNPITTLEHAGASTVFYGKNSLVEAYNASVNGDYLYLSTGFFTAPATIAKGVKIIGAGHFPDSANVAKRTYILSGLTINKGADSLLLEGLFINGDINYQGDASINYVKVLRCRFVNMEFNSTNSSYNKNYCSLVECIIQNRINFYRYGSNLNVSHCFIGDDFYGVDGSALIDGNVFFNSGGGVTFQGINSSIIRNNIILRTDNPINDCSGNLISNNLFVTSTPNFETNSYANNYLGVTQSSIFITTEGSNFNYTRNYHLNNPTTYIGTDGTQVGLYGGATPFKDKGLPSNPQIIKKEVGDQTDTNGNLQINFKVKAQEN